VVEAEAEAEYSKSNIRFI